MELTPEQQQAIEAQKAQCPFCQIIAGKIPSKKVYEDKEIIAILDINPASEGHMLVMPKEHYPIMPLIPQETFKHLFKRSRDLTEVAQKALLCKSTSIFIANGAAAGQQSAHFMLHIIPNEGNVGSLEVPAKGITDDEKQELEGQIKPVLNAMLAKNLGAMGYVEPAKQPPTPKMTKEELIATLKSTKDLADYVKKDREGFKKLIPTHPQLSVLFKDFDIDEILDAVEGNETAKKEEKKEEADLDTITEMFK